MLEVIDTLGGFFVCCQLAVFLKRVIVSFKQQVRS